MQPSKGFTLIELMIVIAVVAVIAAIAIPAYGEQVRKSRRAEASRFVGEMQLSLERWRAENPCYGTTPNPPCASLSGTYPPLPDATTSAFYELEIVAANTTTTNYRITATPRTGSVQADDRCGVLTLDRSTDQGKPAWGNPACN